ncbi:hypothetical protein DFJ74DRAFT_764504 [Hyaloraphidium curvatum]|nr:hypothetical protein DFJ74DRAFT_764504 [Hyaloraphidium curvatum]
MRLHFLLLLALAGAASAQETWCGKRYKTPDGKDPPPSHDPFRRVSHPDASPKHGERPALVLQKDSHALGARAACNLSDECALGGLVGNRGRNAEFNVAARMLPYSWESRGSLLFELDDKMLESTEGSAEGELGGESRALGHDVEVDAVREDDPSSGLVERTRVSRGKLHELPFDLDRAVAAPSGAADASAGRILVRVFDPPASAHPARERTVPVLRVRPRHPRGGSIVKIDGLYRASFADADDGQGSVPFLGFGGMTSGEWVLGNASESMRSFRERGLSMVHVVPGGPLTDAAPWRALFDAAHANGLRVQYNLRHTYRNLSQLLREVREFRDHPALHSWYTADEPDGFDEDERYPRLAYELCRREDPHHPVALVLNCRDFRTADFVPAADILYADPYPIGVDCSRCDAGFGCCGCDMCAPSGGVREVALRTGRMVDAMRGKFGPAWIVVQAFGPESWWSRHPTPAELRAMVYLALAEGATGISWWISPSPLEGELGAIAGEVRGFAARRLGSLPFPVRSKGRQVHAAAWEGGDGGLLVVAVNAGEGRVRAELDGLPRGTVEVLVGPEPEKGHKVVLEALGVSVFVVHRK